VQLDITDKNVSEMKAMLADVGLVCVSIIPDHFAQKRWGCGVFTSRDSNIRQAAVAETKAMMDAAVELGRDLVNLWPGQDGYDYPFQGQFDLGRDRLVEGIGYNGWYAMDQYPYREDGRGFSPIFRAGGQPFRSPAT